MFKSMQVKANRQRFNDSSEMSFLRNHGWDGVLIDFDEESVSGSDAYVGTLTKMFPLLGASKEDRIKEFKLQLHVYYGAGSVTGKKSFGLLMETKFSYEYIVHGYFNADKYDEELTRFDRIADLINQGLLD